MPALSFKKQFATMVESGKKHQTIRKTRKRPIKGGDKLYLYTGMRTKSCRKLGEAVCKSAENIEIFNTDLFYFPNVIVGCIRLSVEETSKIIRDYGFEFEKDFYDFFMDESGRLRFKGQLIKW